MKRALFLFFALVFLLTPVFASLPVLPAGGVPTSAMGAAEPETAYEGEQGYNVVFRGSWTAGQKQEVMRGVKAVGRRLAKLYPNRTPQKAFNIAFGKVIFKKLGNSSIWCGLASGNTISLKSGCGMDQYLVVHELGHIFNNVKNGKPYRVLARQGVVDANGKLVTGRRNGRYNRHMGLRAPKNGYKTNGTSRYMMHPKNLVYGNTACEDFADMFLNWVYGTFVNNRRGRALEAWMTWRMGNWTKK